MQQNDFLEKEIRNLRVEVEKLRAQTDVKIALLPIVDAFTEHEAAAEARFARSLVVWNMIAKQLGAEPDA